MEKPKVSLKKKYTNNQASYACQSSQADNRKALCKSGKAGEQVRFGSLARVVDPDLPLQRANLDQMCVDALVQAACEQYRESALTRGTEGVLR